MTAPADAISLCAVVNKPENWDQLTPEDKLAWYEQAEDARQGSSQQVPPTPEAPSVTQTSTDTSPSHHMPASGGPYLAGSPPSNPSTSDAPPNYWSAAAGPTPVPGQPSPARKRRTAVIIATAALILAVVGVFAYVGIQNHRDAVAAQNAEDAAAAKKAAHKNAVRACKAAIGDFVQTLQDLDSRLDVGLNQADYNQAVGDASVEAGHISKVTLSVECKSAYDHAEAALNTYRQVNTDWNSCIYIEDDCDPQDGGTDFSPWTEASTEIDDAAAAMEAGTVVGRAGT